MMSNVVVTWISSTQSHLSLPHHVKDQTPGLDPAYRPFAYLGQFFYIDEKGVERLFPGTNGLAEIVYCRFGIAAGSHQEHQEDHQKAALLCDAFWIGERGVASIPIR